MAKSIAMNSLYNFTLKFFRLIVPIIVSSYVVRTLDQQLYAEFQSASTWLDFALIFGVFGVTAYGIRYGTAGNGHPSCFPACFRSTLLPMALY